MPPATEERCSRCGAELLPDVRGTLCAACLLESALEDPGKAPRPDGSTAGGLDGSSLLEGNPRTRHESAFGNYDANPSLEIGWEKESLTPFLRRFGDYELLEEIARGGMGIVYRARQVGLGRQVAVKMILAGQFSTRELIQRFRSEAAAAARLQHPNIVAIHEVGVQEGQHFFSMDYVQGKSLAEIVREGPLPPGHAARYVQIVAEAIHYAHEQGVLHRDLKPSNVLIDAATDQPRITDFGLAKRLDANSDLTVTGQVLGSPNFMPPEQAEPGRGNLGRYSDVYSLGAILYQLLTGRPPFQGGTLEDILLQVLQSDALPPRALNRGVPPDLQTICMKCLEKEPLKRYATAQALAEDLGRYLRHEPIQARPVSRWEKGWRWCRRKPALAGFATATLVLLLTVSIGSPIVARRAVAAARELSRHLYVSDIGVAWQALQDQQIGLARGRVQNYLNPGRSAENLRGFEWRLIWERSRPNFVHCFNEHLGVLNCAIFSPDGRWLATAGRDRVVVVWDVASKKPVKKLRGFRAFIDTKAVVFSPDGRFLAAKGGTRLLVWRTDNWQAATLPLDVESNWNGNNAVVFSPDSSTLATRAPAGVAFWDTHSWRETAKLPYGQTKDLGLVMDYSNDGQMLAIADGEALQIRDGRQPTNLVRKLARSPQVSGSRVSSIAISTNYLAAGYRDGQVVLWKRGTWEQVASINAKQSFLMALAFSPDGRLLATGGFSQTVSVWDVEELLTSPGKAEAMGPRNTLRGHLRELTSVAFSPDGRTLASSSHDGTAMLWDVPPRPERPNLPGSVWPIGFSADGRVLAAVHKDGRIHRWNVQDRSDLGAVGPILPEEDPRYQAALAPAGDELAFALANGDIELWQASPALRIRALRGDGNPIENMQFSPDPHRRDLLVVSKTGDHRRFHLHRIGGQSQAESELLAEFPVELSEWAHESSFTFSWDGRLLAMVDAAPGINLFDLPNRGSRRLGIDSEVFQGLAFSPDGTLLAAASVVQPVIWFWDLKSGRPPVKLNMEYGGVFLLRFSPDGKTLLSSDYDNNIRFWNVALKKEILTLANFNPMFSSIWFSPQGNALALLTSRDSRPHGGAELFAPPSLEEIDEMERTSLQTRSAMRR